ncbi:hypothetical protein D3C85_658200 [compost metagenome]
MNRTPPIEVQRILRKENGYKCVIPNCEIPYLEYHHFNPPWHIENHHNPEGMIALCPQHHRQADGGAYTNAQLDKFKVNARQEFEKVKGEFQYLRNQILLIAGGNFYLNNNIEVSIKMRPVIWFEKDENDYKLLNIELLDQNNNIYFKIENNVWSVINNVKDIECPPNGRKLNINFKNGDNIKLEFKELKNEEDILKINSSNFNFLNSVRNTLPITVLSLEMKLEDSKINFKKDKSLIGNASMVGCFASNNGIGLSL